MDRNLNAAINILKLGLEAQQGGNAPDAPKEAMTTAGTIPRSRLACISLKT